MNGKVDKVPMNSCPSDWPEQQKPRRLTSGDNMLKDTVQLEERQQGSLESLDLQFYDTDQVLRQHFHEVIRRHHLVLAQKNQQIEKLQEALARHRREDGRDTENTSQAESSSDQNHKMIAGQHVMDQGRAMNTDHDFITNSWRESSTCEQHMTNKTSCVETEMEAFRAKEEPLMDKMYLRATEYPMSANERFEKTNNLTTDKERFGIVDRQSKKNEDWMTDESGINHRHHRHRELSDMKTLLSTEHKTALNRADQRLFIDHMKLQGLTKTGLVTDIEKELTFDEKRVMNSSLDEKSYEQKMGYEKVRKEHKGIAGLEELGQDFMRRLNFEEQLDKLHWQIEARKLFADQKEYKMLVIARNNLLKSLRELKRKTGIDEKDVAKNSNVTFKTLYRPSSPLDFSSDGELL